MSHIATIVRNVMYLLITLSIGQIIQLYNKMVPDLSPEESQENLSMGHLYASRMRCFLYRSPSISNGLRIEP